MSNFKRIFKMKRVLRILIVVDFLLLITSILVGNYRLMHIGVNEVLIKQMEEIHNNSMAGDDTLFIKLILGLIFIEIWNWQSLWHCNKYSRYIYVILCIISQLTVFWSSNVLDNGIGSFSIYLSGMVAGMIICVVFFTELKFAFNEVESQTG